MLRRLFYLIGIVVSILGILALSILGHWVFWTLSILTLGFLGLGISGLGILGFCILGWNRFRKIKSVYF